MIRVEALKTSDGLWHLQSFCVTTDQVYMLLTFSKLIDLIDTACLLQLHIDNELPLNQYYMVKAA